MPANPSSYAYLDGRREVPMQEFFTLPSEGNMLRETQLAPNEVLCPVCKVVIRSTRELRPGDRVYCMPCMSRLVVVEGVLLVGPLDVLPGLAQVPGLEVGDGDVRRHVQVVADAVAQGEAVAAAGGAGPETEISFASFMSALLAVMFAYNSWHEVTPLAEEIKDPQRNVPWATGLFGAT